MNRFIVPLYRGTRPLYNYSHVQMLADNARRHNPDAGFTVVCDEHHLDKCVQHLRDIEVVPMTGPSRGGSTPSLEIYRPDVVGNDKCVSMGIDTVIFGSCGWMFNWNESPIGFTKSSRPELGNALTVYGAEAARVVWPAYLEQTDWPVTLQRAGVPSDEKFLAHVATGMGWTTLLPTGRLISYKRQILKKKIRNLDGITAVYMCLRPKQWELKPDDPIRMEFEGRS